MWPCGSLHGFCWMLQGENMQGHCSSSLAKFAGMNLPAWHHGLYFLHARLQLHSLVNLHRHLSRDFLRGAHNQHIPCMIGINMVCWLAKVFGSDSHSPGPAPCGSLWEGAQRP